jgi:aldehyde decarbonylase
MVKGENERDIGYFLILPFLLLRMLHNQIWISLSRYRTAKGNNRIVDKGIEFEQVDRERNWYVRLVVLLLFHIKKNALSLACNEHDLVLFTYRDDQILFNGILFYVGYLSLPGSHNLPFWRSDGVVITCLLHAGPVEFLYYWLHRALHHHYLYSRYHSHHHSSIVTEPITCKILFIL